MINTITPSFLKKKKFLKTYLRISKKKRRIGSLIHSAWEKYEKEFYSVLLDKKELKTRDFEYFLMQTRKKIIRSFTESTDLQEISLFIHKLIQKIRKLIKSISFNSRVKVDDFVTHYFGGILLLNR